MDGGPVLVSHGGYGGRRRLDVLFTPADFGALSRRDLSRTTCVVFDVLRATTSMVTALSQGAEAIVPVSDIPEAIAWRNRVPEVLLAGERDGRRILADRTGGVDFDLGNSPREFVSERVGGRWIVATTSNGTRALRASGGARVVLPACLRNRRAVAQWLESDVSEEWVFVCSGTLEDSAYEDVLGAGALVDRLWPRLADFEVLDGARMARLLYQAVRGDLAGAMRQHSRNGRRLARMEELAADIGICAAEDDLNLVAGMDRAGVIRTLRAGSQAAREILSP
jgi:2-phosphosulfolactate phosphatase